MVTAAQVEAADIAAAWVEVFMTIAAHEFVSPVFPLPRLRDPMLPKPKLMPQGGHGGADFLGGHRLRAGLAQAQQARHTRHGAQRRRRRRCPTVITTIAATSVARIWWPQRRQSPAHSA